MRDDRRFLESKPTHLRRMADNIESRNRSALIFVPFMAVVGIVWALFHSGPKEDKSLSTVKPFGGRLSESALRDASRRLNSSAFPEPRNFEEQEAQWRDPRILEPMIKAGAAAIEQMKAQYDFKKLSYAHGKFHEYVTTVRNDPYKYPEAAGFANKLRDSFDPVPYLPDIKELQHMTDTKNFSDEEFRLMMLSQHFRGELSSLTLGEVLAYMDRCELYMIAHREENYKPALEFRDALLREALIKEGQIRKRLKGAGNAEVDNETMTAEAAPAGETKVWASSIRESQAVGRGA